MKSFLRFSFVLVFSLPFLAHAKVIATGLLKPDPKSIRSCRDLGFSGRFVLSDREPNTNIGHFLFKETQRGFVVFKDGPTAWRMSIMGSGPTAWSESISVDLDGRTLKYASSRPQYEGTCSATF